MSDDATPIISLSKHRKARARRDARAEADRNAVFHGLTKAEKAQAKAEQDRAREALDGHHTGPDETDAP